MSISETRSSSTSKTTQSHNTKESSAAVKASSKATEPTSSTAPTSKDKIDISSESRAAETGASTAVNFDAWGKSPTESTQSAAVAPAAASSDLGSATLSSGSKGENVESLQRMLNEKTGAGLEVDGKFGKKTLEAVKKFQESQGLEVDGLVGKNTKAAFAGGAQAQATPAGEAGQAPSGSDLGGTAQADAPASAAEASQAAESAAQKAAADGAGQQPEAAPAGKAESTGTPGTSDTSWTEQLPAKLRPHADAFVAAGKKYGVDPRLLAAISMQETGGGTSNAFNNKNNAMGIMGKSGIRQFDSVAASIDSQARSLTREGGYYTGANTIDSIAGIYAPVGASNDSGNLNRHWKNNVGDFYQRLGGTDGAQVKGFSG